MSIFANIFRSLPANRPSGGGGSLAAPRQMPTSISSIFDLIRPQAPAQFDVTQAQGSKPKNYRPTSISMTGVPVASVFGLASANQLPSQVFDVTAAQGTKAKNYRPTQISMNAPTVAGPAAMQEMLALMQTARRPTPFAPFGQTQGQY